MVQQKGRGTDVKLIVNTDGGSRGNPGIAGAGAVVYAEDGTELAARWDYLQRGTNNVAEYRGLIGGLELAGRVAQRLGERAETADVSVRMDSKLLVEQMNGRFKIKNAALKELAQQAQGIRRGLGNVTFEWVPRAENKRADELANRAMDRRESGSEGPDGPRREKPEQRETARPTPAKQRPTQLLLLRHGENPLSVEGRFAGVSNPELTERGHRQAELAGAYLAKRFAVDAIVASPMIRARQTAEHVARACAIPPASIDSDPDLREIDFGRWEAKTFREVREQHAEEFTAMMADPSQAPHGGESVDALYRRVTQAMARIAADHAGRTVAVVTHMMPIKSMVRCCLGSDASVYRRTHLDLASLTVVRLAGRPTLMLMNDAHYLEDLD
ncbi:bifunctional RNase H/acid phosphatase [Corynebacterium heidelbergense]|uniref:bifunctional RNase H/acid phosphatase n=1 Tax=Corynebacterium heidelbergense TaxID=2055947 RepID=UPI001930E657|nr:bifunctional RNase H/acid phosphatase [Corynebacterium heidelbergense]